LSNNIYTPELAIEICDAIATGPLGLARLCELNKHFPDQSTIFGWIVSKPDFKLLYDEAKKNQIHNLAESIQNACQIPNLTEEITTEYSVSESGEKVITKTIKIKDNTSRSRLIVDTQKWLLSKLDPKKYGEKTILSGDVNAPLSLTITKLALDDVDPSSYRS
jgi:hypothetical protein